MRIPGHHEVLDAAAAIALSIELLKTDRAAGSGVDSAEVTAGDIKKLQDALLSFEGAKRRSEIIGEAGNCVFIDDYGHHPTAIKTTINGFRSFYPDRVLIVDFMSHTYTRTAALLEDFASSFGDADEVILHKIYPSARETEPFPFEPAICMDLYAFWGLLSLLHKNSIVSSQNIFFFGRRSKFKYESSQSERIFETSLFSIQDIIYLHSRINNPGALVDFTSFP